MTPEQKKSELQRHRTILLAALDYLEERLGGSIVLDQYDPASEYYQQQKIQTEKYFKQHRLDRLQQRFTTLTKGLQNSDNLAFAAYIKKKTGYEIDLFKEVQRGIDNIIAQDEIRTQKELNDVSVMLQFYHDTSADVEELEKLKGLLLNYAKRSNITSSKRNADHTEVVSTAQKEDIEIVKVRISTGSKTKHFEEQKAISPDGKRMLRVVQWSNRRHASTYVSVEFPTANGTVYSTNGNCPDVKASWKDNTTIIIETHKNYLANVQHLQVSSFDDIISIKYILH